MFGSSIGSTEPHAYDITDIGFIKRVVVGTTSPDRIPTEEETGEQVNFLNRCLSEYPKGRIVGVERNFSVIRVGEHQVVLESVGYHIGFKKEPMWMQELKRRKPEFTLDHAKVESIIKNSH